MGTAIMDAVAGQVGPGAVNRVDHFHPPAAPLPPPLGTVSHGPADSPPRAYSAAPAAAAAPAPAVSPAPAPAPTPAPTPPPVAGSADRDASGRFTRGNRAARGNPVARKMAGLRSVLLDAVSPRDVREIGQRLVQAAKVGDLDAARLLFDYILGKPTKAPDADRLDQEEWELLAAAPAMAHVLDQLALGADPGFAAELAHELQPQDLAGFRVAVREAMRRKLEAAFYHPNQDDEGDADDAEDDAEAEAKEAARGT